MKSTVAATFREATYMALPDLGSTKTWALGFAGSAVLVILILRMVHLYAKKQWGEMIVEVIGGVVMIYFCFANDLAIAQMKALGTMVFG